MWPRTNIRARRHRRSATSSISNASRYSCEALERRLLLSTITWTNIGSTSNDTDGFTRVFGNLDNQARGVINADIAYWQRTISNFNYADGTNTYNISISMNANPITSMGNGVGANASANAFIGNKPSGGSCGIGWRNIAASGNSSNGWFLDPTPMDNSEFQGTLNNAFSQSFTTNQGGDLFTGVLHELGHAFGLYAGGQLNNLATDTKVVDTLNAPAASPPATYWRFDGPSVQTLWTGWDSGGAGGAPSSRNGPQHSAPSGAQVTVGGTTYYGAVDLMNAYFTSRSIISDNDALMLRDAYGYSITPPDSFGTFYDTLDANGTLRITGPPGLSNDAINISSVGETLFVSIKIGSPVNGADPVGYFTSDFSQLQVKLIQITTQGGNDTIGIQQTGTTPIQISGGSGNNTLSVIGSYGNTVITGSSIIGGGQNITQISGIQNLTIEGTTGNDTFTVNGVPASNRFSIDGKGGDDTLNVGSGSIASITRNFTFTGGDGNDTININNQSNPDAYAYVLSDNILICTDRSTGVGVTINYNTVESYVVNGGDGNNLFELISTPGPSTVRGGAGNDTFQIGNAFGPASTIGLPVIDGGGGTNTVFVDDEALGGNVSYLIGIDGAGNSANVLSRPGFSFNYSSIQVISLTAGPGDNIVTIGGELSLPSVLNVNTGPGNDTVNFGNGYHVGNFAGAVVHLDAGSGTNTLNMDGHLSNPGFNENYNITSNSVNEFWAFGPLGSFTYANFATLRIEASAGNNVFNIISSAAGTPIGINGNGGNDTFNVTATDGAGRASILGQLFLTGGNGNNALVVNSSADPNGIGYTIDAGRITPLGSADIYYSVKSLTVNTGPGPDLFNIAGTNITTILNTGGGADVINVTPQGQNLDTIQALLTVNGNSASSLTVNDQNNPNFVFTQDILTSTATTALTRIGQKVDAFGLPIIHVATIDCSGIGLLTLNTGFLANVVNVEGTATPVTVNPGPGTAVINVDKTSPAAPVTIGPGVANEPVTVNSNGTGTAAAVFAATQRIGALTIGAGGTATVLPGGGKVLTVPSLSISGTGRLDLTDESMIVDYTGSSPAAAVKSLLTSGYAGGTWNGRGIVTSSADATHGLGFADSADGIVQGLAAHSVLVKWVNYGDATLDGKVDFKDLVILARHYGNNSSAANWDTGDFNYDGKVDFGDLVMLARSYGHALASPVAGAAAGVHRASADSNAVPTARFRRMRGLPH